MDRFDGVALRDVQLSDDVGVAVDAAGDVIQWGIGFDQLHPEPVSYTHLRAHET